MASNLETVLTGIRDRCEAVGNAALEAAQNVEGLGSAAEDLSSIDEQLQAVGTSVEELARKLKEAHAEALGLGAAIDGALGVDPKDEMALERWTDTGDLGLDSAPLDDF